MSEAIDHERRDDDRTRDIVDRVANQAAERAATTAVPQAVAATLKSLGLDTSDPITIQKNMAFLDESRKRCEKFYGTMWDNMIALFWRVVKYVLIIGVLGVLAKLGLQVEAVKSLFGGLL